MHCFVLHFHSRLLTLHLLSGITSQCHTITFQAELNLWTFEKESRRTIISHKDKITPHSRRKLKNGCLSKMTVTFNWSWMKKNGSHPLPSFVYQWLDIFLWQLQSVLSPPVSCPQSLSGWRTHIFENKQPPHGSELHEDGRPDQVRGTKT